jgi:hypothetical protein
MWHKGELNISEQVSIIKSEISFGLTRLIKWRWLTVHLVSQWDQVRSELFGVLPEEEELETEK